MNQAMESVKKLKSALQKVVRGRNDTINYVLTGLFSGGHVLLEDYPGSGKTTLAKTLGGLIDTSQVDHERGIVPFRRIQFTPDLLPSDILGVNIYDTKSGTFHFQRGPIFAHIVLADEINRTGPKVQAAFLECLAERQVTLDNSTYKLDHLFFVIGTQNPLDMAGTFPLPLVQLDRFLLKIPMAYVDSQVEFEILRDADEIAGLAGNQSPVIDRDDVLQVQQASSQVVVTDQILRAIVALVQSTRESNLLEIGASTRAAIMLRKALCAWALIHERDFVTEDDLKHLSPVVLLHRLKFHSGAGHPLDAFNSLLEPVIENLIRSGWQ